MIEVKVIIQVASAVYSLKNNMNALLDKKANEELQLAYNYLSDNKVCIDLVRMALQHMETAYVLLDKDPFLNADDRITNINKLCYYIAKLHYELGDPYDTTVKYWAGFVNCEYCFLDEFKTILKEEDWCKMNDIYKAHLRKLWDDALSYNPLDDYSVDFGI